MSVRSALLTAALLAAPTLLVAQSPAADAAAPTPTVHPRAGNELELGRLFTNWIYTAQFDSLFAHMREETRTSMGSPDEMAEQFDGFTGQVGEETKLLGEMVVMRKGNPQYWRTAEFSMAPEPIQIRWVIVDGEIWGLGINPASQAPPIDPDQD
ncbi:MAG: hypothetical protein E4H41_02330 [Gemmatimonadales bacterium]|jgi:hypothetical protein|nr:MAG: hypothetical protein E4H41_02330 [Gemmatimonadales bacterium]